MHAPAIAVAQPMPPPAGPAPAGQTADGEAAPFAQHLVAQSEEQEGAGTSEAEGESGQAAAAIAPAPEATIPAAANVLMQLALITAPSAPAAADVDAAPVAGQAPAAAPSDAPVTAEAAALSPQNAAAPASAGSKPELPKHASDAPEMDAPAASPEPALPQVQAPTAAPLATAALAMAPAIAAPPASAQEATNAAAAPQTPTIVAALARPQEKQAETPAEPKPQAGTPKTNDFTKSAPAAESAAASQPAAPETAAPGAGYGSLASLAPAAPAAPATAASAQLAHVAPPPPATQQAAREIVRRFDGEATRFELRLDPPELGRVEVRLEVTRDNRVTAVLAADNPQALTELARGARDLELALQSAGLELADNGLHFDLRRQRGDAGGAEGNSAKTADDSGSAAETGAAARPLSYESWRGLRVDLLV